MPVPPKRPWIVGVGLDVGFEEFGQHIGGNADAGIKDRRVQPVVGAAALDPEFERHGAVAW